MPLFDFGGSKFKSQVQNYCSSAGWKVSEADNEHAVVKFDMPSGRTQSVLITQNNDENMSFLVVSMFKFDTEDKVPHFLSTILMKRNTAIMIGKWGINVVGETHVYTVGHSLDMNLTNADQFKKVVLILVKECDDLESVLMKVINQ
jgi:hypothetical protein